MRLWETYYTVTSLDEAVRLLAEHGADARIMAGGTDLIIEIEKGLRKPNVLIDITRVHGLDSIKLGDDGLLHVGPMVTHTQAAASDLLQEHALPLAQACWWVGAPALRNRGTIAGNLVTASPANDTITALRALDATLILKSASGKRSVKIADFYTGVRRTVLQPGELIADIVFPPLKISQRGVYLKLGLRKILAIAVTNVAMVVDRDDAGVVKDARIALGSVAPTIVRAAEAEKALVGETLTEAIIAEVAQLAIKGGHPIDDVRGTAWFRSEEISALVQQGLTAIKADQPRLGLPEPEDMVKLYGKRRSWPHLKGETIAHTTDGDEPIQCVVNGESVSVTGANGKTLLRMLREDLKLTGSKVGCEEGECGACSIWLDGIAALACLIPAPRAHGACITTIEGLSTADAIHPVQQAFIEEDAVQCGYCTPGFVISAAKLLEEFPQPSREQIKVALSGNLCRCTGYYKIITAVESAAAKLNEPR